MGLKCFATATAAQNGVGTHLLAAPCGTSAATAVASAHVNDSTCNNGIQLIAAPLLQPLPLRVNEPLNLLILVSIYYSSATNGDKHVIGSMESNLN